MNRTSAYRLYRQERLNENWFESIYDARQKFEAWRLTTRKRSLHRPVQPEPQEIR